MPKSERAGRRKDALLGLAVALLGLAVAQLGLAVLMVLLGLAVVLVLLKGPLQLSSEQHCFQLIPSRVLPVKVVPSLVQDPPQARVISRLVDVSI